jgi:site-specific DNA-cytosine methylase
LKARHDGSPRGDGRDNLIVSPPPLCFENRQDPILYGEQAGPLGFKDNGKAILDMRGNGDGRTRPTITGDHASRPTDYTPIVFSETGPGFLSEGVHALRAEGENRPSRPTHTIKTGRAVRRLTPRECERLQGFPDDYTLIPYRGGVAADGPRYKALGNSMAVPVMRWIAERIEMLEAD